jgi:hypothetical protein
MFAENRKLGLETCFHDLMMEVEKPWGVCWGSSAQLLQCKGISLSLSLSLSLSQSWCVIQRVIT